MEKFSSINADDLEVILGGDGHGSVFLPENWWI